MKRFAVTIFLTLWFINATAFAADPLPSWNDTAQKQAIITFVERVTQAGSPDFVPPAERIATFDNDGTLWSEQPMYFQQNYIFDRVKALAPQHPEWKDSPLFKAALEDDVPTISAAGDRAFLEFIAALHVGFTTEEVEQSIKDWLATAKHPKTGRLYTELLYQPMLELLDYLRANGFKTYIVSAGWAEFMRPWTEKAYGIPAEQIIASSIKTQLELHDGKLALVHLPEINFLALREGKAIGINDYIGRRPIAAFGNSDGDLQMLQWTTAGNGASFALLVHHTDAEREFAYDLSTSYGRLDKALVEAKAKAWTVVDMKNDWKVVYPFEQK